MSKELSQKIANCLRNKPVKKAFLFGSASRNEEDENSDVDILIELDYSQPIGLSFVRLKFELEDILERKVDLISSNSISKYIQPFIDLDKILVYER